MPKPNVYQKTSVFMGVAFSFRKPIFWPFVICQPESRLGKFVFYAYKLQSESCHQIIGDFMYRPKDDPVALQNQSTIVRFNNQSKDFMTS